METPEVLGILGIPEETGDDGGSSSSGVTSRKKTVEEIYMEAKRGGASTQELDNYLKQAISDGAISRRAATDLRDKRW